MRDSSSPSSTNKTRAVRAVAGRIAFRRPAFKSSRQRLVVPFGQYCWNSVGCDDDDASSVPDRDETEASDDTSVCSIDWQQQQQQQQQQATTPRLSLRPRRDSPCPTIGSGTIQFVTMRTLPSLAAAASPSVSNLQASFQQLMMRPSNKYTIHCASPGTRPKESSSSSLPPATTTLPSLPEVQHDGNILVTPKPSLCPLDMQKFQSSPPANIAIPAGPVSEACTFAKCPDFPSSLFLPNDL